MDLQHATGLAVGTSRGRAGRKGRRFIRDAATIEREHRALELLVKGVSQADIARKLEMSPGGVSMLIRRALEYRASALTPTVEQARALIMERLERLLERWWPLATGDYVDPDTGSSENPPNARAVDTVLKILDQMARLTGADKGRVETPKPGDGATYLGGIHVHSTPPAEREQMIGAVLGLLTVARKKHDFIEGQLADARTSLSELVDGQSDDRPGPPPTHEETAA